MKMRAPLGDPAYWAEWVAFGEESIALGWETASKPFGDPSYAPQYLFELAQDHWHQMLRRYSAGLPTPSLASYFPGLLDAWERSQALGAQQWTEDQVYTRNAWRVNYDHYITCFWVVALALVLEIPDEQWQRLIRLVGNEGEDSLLDRVIATRSPQRCIGGELLYPKPYGRLQTAIDAERPQQASLLRDFVDHWYLEPAMVRGLASTNRLQRSSTPTGIAMAMRTLLAVRILVAGASRLRSRSRYLDWMISFVSAMNIIHRRFCMSRQICHHHQ